MRNDVIYKKAGILAGMEKNVLCKFFEDFDHMSTERVVEVIIERHGS